MQTDEEDYCIIQSPTLPVVDFLKRLSDPSVSDAEMVSIVKIIRKHMQGFGHIPIRTKPTWVKAFTAGCVLGMGGFIVVLVCGGAHIGISPFTNILIQHTGLSSTVILKKLALAAGTCAGHCMTQTGSVVILKAWRDK